MTGICRKKDTTTGKTARVSDDERLFSRTIPEQIQET